MIAITVTGSKTAGFQATAPEFDVSVAGATLNEAINRGKAAILRALADAVEKGEAQGYVAGLFRVDLETEVEE